MRKRIKYSQNFLKDGKLVNSLIDKASLDSRDIVYEIGAGQGIITQELVRRVGKVVAFEIDINLANKLKENFESYGKRVEIVNEDFLKWRLPVDEYKVFSNIPFNITADVVKKLLFNKNSPTDCYLIMQSEAAKKFVGKPLDHKNSLVAMLLKADFDTSIFHKFNKSDFFPKPSVDTLMVRFRRLDKPYVDKQDKSLFYDFVAFGFSQFEPNILKGLGKVISESMIIEVSQKYHFSPNLKPSQLSLDNWLSLFDVFKQLGNIKKVIHSYESLQAQQATLQKVHRTRLDKSWRKYS